MSHEPADADTGPRRSRELFDRACDGLDHGMAFRLRRARAQSQAQQPRTNTRPRGLPLLAPLGVAAAALLALGVAWWRPPSAQAPAAPANVALSEKQEIELLLTSDEDPELYAWLADAPVAGHPRETP